MKTITRIAAICGTLFIGGIANAQDTPAPPAPQTTPSKDVVQPATAPAARARVADGWRGLPLGMLVKQVGLTPEQTQKGKELNAKYMKEYQALDANMPLEERTAKVKTIMDAREAEVKAMLTPEQQEQYKNLRTPSGEPRGQGRTGPEGKARPNTMTKEATAPSKVPAPAQEKPSDK